MKRYQITYTDCGDENTMRLKAYDHDHAEEKFWDAIEDWQGDHRGINLLRIRQIKN